MARPIKKGLDYFAFDVDAFEDDKFSYVRGEVGPLGDLILVRLLAAIYRVGYAYRWDEKVSKIFAGRIQVDSETCRKAVDAALEIGFFDQNLFETSGLLSSKGIQKRYLRVCTDLKRRAGEDGFIKPEHDLVNSNPRRKPQFPPEETPVSSSESVKMEGYPLRSEEETTQMKRKEKKRKETINNTRPPGKRDPLTYLTPEQCFELEDLKKRGFEFETEKIDPGTMRMPLKDFPDVWLAPNELANFLNTCARVGEPEREIFKLVQNNNRGKPNITNIGRSANAIEGWALETIMRRSNHELKNRRLTKQ